MGDNDGVFRPRPSGDHAQGTADPGGQLISGLAAREALAQLAGPPPGQRCLVGLPCLVIMAAIQVAHVDLAQVLQLRRYRYLQAAETISAVWLARRSGKHISSP